MGPPSYMRSVFDRNVVMWRMIVLSLPLCQRNQMDLNFLEICSVSALQDGHC